MTTDDEILGSVEADDRALLYQARWDASTAVLHTGGLRVLAPTVVRETSETALHGCVIELGKT